MPINIAAMDAATKLAFAQAVGSVLLASGEITIPTDFVDLALPAGYSKFVLELQGVLMDVADQISFQLSSDGGTTFHQGASDYKNFNINAAYGQAGSTPEVQSFADTQGTLIYDSYNGGAADNVAAIATVHIWPGSNSSYPVIQSYATCRTANSQMPATVSSANQMIAEAARQNYIRVGPYFGDGTKWIAGSYRLIGLA